MNPLKQIALALESIALKLLELTGVLQILGIKLDKTAVEDSPYLLQRRISDIRDATVLNASSNVNLLAHLHSIIALLGDGIPGVLDAIAALPAGSSIPTASDNASGVWNALDPFSDDEALPYGQELANAHRWATFSISGGSLPAKYSPFFNVSYPPPSPDTIPSDYTWPQPDWANILAYDTLVSWLVRTCPDFSWTTDASGENVIGYLTSLYEPEAPHFTPRLTQTEWARVYGARAAKAPIWPGIDGVTLGTTVPAAASTVLEIPMDGILWVTTDYPPARSRWGAAPYYSVYHTGRLAFITDNGDLEPFQYMGWQNAVYVPQTMGRAAGVVVFLEANIEGAITPWDISV
jgi:hypothetical protein